MYLRVSYGCKIISCLDPTRGARLAHVAESKHVIDAPSLPLPPGSYLVFLGAEVFLTRHATLKQRRGVVVQLTVAVPRARCFISRPIVVVVLWYAALKLLGTSVAAQALTYIYTKYIPVCKFSCKLVYLRQFMVRHLQSCPSLHRPQGNSVAERVRSTMLATVLYASDT